MGDLFDIPFEEPPDDAAPAPRARGARRRPVTVTELTTAIRATLETGFDDLWVEGELSNCRVWNTTGHMYFTLKDRGAQIRGVMFRSAVRLLKFKPEDGLQAVVRGRISVYEPKGEYQLVCDRMDPQGLGALQLAFEQMKKKLAAEGLFDQARKRALPALPRKIGVVTSLEGAAVRDILKVLRRRHPNAHLVIRPARVQGDGAGAEVAAGVRAIGRVPGVDVIIVARGGGSAEDLRAFNEESVARAIAGAPVPVVSGVGHEVDFTIADFVADLRAPTPSAAAELVVAAKDEFCGRIDRLAHRLAVSARAAIQHRRAAVHGLTSRRGLAGLPARLAMRGRHAAELTHHLRRAAVAGLARRERGCRALQLRLEARDLRRHLAALRGRLVAGRSRLGAAVTRNQDRAGARLATLTARLDSLSPLGVLARGYAVCWNEDRTAIIRRADTLTPGERVRVRLQHGEIACRVEGS